MNDHSFVVDVFSNGGHVSLHLSVVVQVLNERLKTEVLLHVILHVVLVDRFLVVEVVLGMAIRGEQHVFRLQIPGNDSVLVQMLGRNNNAHHVELGVISLSIETLALLPSGNTVAPVLKLFLNPVGFHEVLVLDDVQRGGA